MASTGQRKRDNRTTVQGGGAGSEFPAGSTMQEPLGSMDRPVPHDTGNQSMADAGFRGPITGNPDIDSVTMQATARERGRDTLSRDADVSRASTATSADDLNDGDVVGRSGYGRESDLTRDTAMRDAAAQRDTTSAVRSDRGFTTTFAIAAVVLLVAFLIALYVGSRGTDMASAPTAPQNSVTESQPSNGSTGTGTGTGTAASGTAGSATTNDATGSITPAPATPPAATNSTGSTTGTTNP